MLTDKFNKGSVNKHGRTDDVSDFVLVKEEGVDSDLELINWTEEEEVWVIPKII